jgi:hypothetical protein
MENNKIVPSEKVIELLVDKFNAINIETKPNDWLHVKDYRVNMTFWERKFFHPSLGYMEVIEEDQELKFHIKLLQVFRYATQSDNLDLIKKLFNELVSQTENPNVQAYYEDSLYNLTNASRKGNLDVIKFLVENGVHIHVEGEANVIEALNSGNYEVVTYFLENDPNINQEVIFNSSQVTEEMVNFVKKWNLYKELDADVVNKNVFKKQLKI